MVIESPDDQIDLAADLSPAGPIWHPAHYWVLAKQQVDSMAGNSRLHSEWCGDNGRKGAAASFWGLQADSGGSDDQTNVCCQLLAAGFGQHTAVMVAGTAEA